MRTILRHLCEAQTGSSIIEVALTLPVLLLLMVGAIDFGRGYYMALEVTSAAQAGAAYGAQNPSDTAGMIAAANLDAPDLKTPPVATYGCVCSSSQASQSGVSQCATVPTCAANVVNYVQVTTTLVYTPLLHYPGIPATFALTGNATMRGAH